ncbi:FkbM family methyltransferase [Brachyspira pilosicoli]|uniref:FkbM family methyltransferase n=1 Tax=Brachyspira pilosicoli TaxID=52584 RepID=UPI0012F4DB1F|nr:FkbM family methyltransferase [Brachyspira pilosicoli]
MKINDDIIKIINDVVWWIPFKKFRNLVRCYFINLFNINNNINNINNNINDINNNIIGLTNNIINLNANINSINSCILNINHHVHNIHEFLIDEINYTNALNDPKRLENYGYKVYSQNDEDGIINEIFNRIGTTNKFFIEFGVQDGIECNCHYLLFQGWEGVFIEGSKDYCDKINKYYESLISKSKLQVINAFITKENINDLISSTKAISIKDIDLLSIDIDGNDYHIFQAIDVINPRVVIIEYNVKFPPPVKWVMPYNSKHVWDGTEKQGASLQAIVDLAKVKGYELVATNISGVNAFFVRKDLYNKDIFTENNSAQNLNNYLKYGWHGHQTYRKFLENDLEFNINSNINED